MPRRNVNEVPVQISRMKMTFGDEEMTLDTYLRPNQLPTNPKKLEVCTQHLENGADQEIYGEFHLLGCDFDAVVEQEDGTHRVEIQFACKGLGMFSRKGCRLKLQQLDENGRVVSEGGF